MLCCVPCCCPADVVLLLLLLSCSGDQTRWYRDAAGNFFVPIPSARQPDTASQDPMGR